MPGSWPHSELPHLNDENSSVTSPATGRYNCIAWAAGDVRHNWWPDPFGIGYWPPNVQRSVTVQAFLEAYGTIGFRLCFDGALEAGKQKLAIFGKGPQGAEVPTHAAIQLESGKWSSKLGMFEDISHNAADDVSGPAYGNVVCYLVRPRS